MGTEVKCTSIVESMSREDFHQKVVQGVARTAEFSQLVCNGAQMMDLVQKDRVRMSLNQAGIPWQDMTTDEHLATIARAITERAVTLT